MERLRAAWARLPGAVQQVLTVVLAFVVLLAVLAFLRWIAPS